MDLNLISAAVFFAVSFVAAAINSVAGGGTFLTFPVFIMNGMTTTQANIMSTIALWPGMVASTFGYRTEMDLARRQVVPLWLSGFGGTAGAFLFLHTPEVTFARLVPWLLLSATLIFTYGKYVVAAMNRLSMSSRARIVFAITLQIVIGIYGGYFGAGMGILTLAMLQVLGHDSIHKMNALKTIITSAINTTTMLVFAFSGKVIWPVAVCMMAGAACGGYTGARMALKVSPALVRKIVSLIGFAMTAYFFLRGV